MTTPAAGRVLRLAVIGWGLGELAMGHTGAGLAWLAAEALLLAAVAAATVLFADTSWYLLPYLLGMAFLATWAGQAVLAYHRAQHRDGAVPPASRRSPALAVAWLTVPLLAWATGFWLVGAGAATPATVVDRFVTGWAEQDADLFASLSADPASLRAVAASTLGRLDELCVAGDLPEDCATNAEKLLRDVRVRMIFQDGSDAVAVAELVRYERRPSTFLGIFQASELVPVPVERILTLELAAEPAAAGAVRWTIVNARGA